MDSLTIARQKTNRIKVKTGDSFKLPSDTREFKVYAENLRMAYEHGNETEYVNFLGNFKEYEGEGSGRLFFKGEGIVEIKTSVC